MNDATQIINPVRGFKAPLNLNPSNKVNPPEVDDQTQVINNLKGKPVVDIASTVVINQNAKQEGKSSIEILLKDDLSDSDESLGSSPRFG